MNPFGEDMPPTGPVPAVGFVEIASTQAIPLGPSSRKPPRRANSPIPVVSDPLLTVDDVARRLNVSKDWYGTTPQERRLGCPSFAWETELFDTGRAALRISSVNGSESLRFGVGVGKMETPTVFPHRKREFDG
jgi:hypothetical protein